MPFKLILLENNEYDTYIGQSKQHLNKNNSIYYFISLDNTGCNKGPFERDRFHSIPLIRSLLVR